MRFELTKALIDDILFSMEDQDGEFYIDTIDGVVAGGPDFEMEDSDGEEDRYISLPEWDSSDGFRLMERFAAGFKNPLIREELSAALNRGRGVFRAFKDVLGQYPEAEKLWFAHKEQAMKQKIIIWYNALREEWGLEKIGREPEETGDLILEDFRFRCFEQEDLDAVRKLHAVCENENMERGVNSGSFHNKAEFPGSLVFCAESGGGDFAGFVSAGIEGNNYNINYLEVKPEYRGLGIGEALLKQLLENIDTSEFSVYIELPANAVDFSRVLARENFKPCMTRYRLSPEKNKD